ncbi:uncharacterized protein C8Q71DRAFT_764429 [Rhodofomes roseus]|uniref:Uncharacterized protein n=1 Tax=Rhodofomes roseus TaxID=34475 RepID=A0ABQ8KC36_9APHY|nr:uncharacterized protein C8Q71DRAFT_764429 [Rhodofomes roseus]KAH9835164.1 hypothetical protein C8Q71DRAFT_764429 [Rhodofomes roseus]
MPCGFVACRSSRGSGLLGAYFSLDSLFLSIFSFRSHLLHMTSAWTRTAWTRRITLRISICTIRVSLSLYYMSHLACFLATVSTHLLRLDLYSLACSPCIIGLGIHRTSTMYGNG